MGLFNGRELEDGYEPGLIARWLIPKDPKDSGNLYNGFGDAETCRPRPQFHGAEEHPWKTMLVYFLMRAYSANVRTSVYWTKHAIRELFGHKRIAKEKIEDTPENFSQRLKARALAHDEVDVVGIARMDPEWMFEGHGEPGYPWIVVLARAMDYDDLSRNLTHREFGPTVAQVIGGYEKTQRAAIDLANWIRAQGWDAKGQGGLTIKKGELYLTIPPAIEAGIGQLGKHGSLINGEIGSAFRISTVLTDMPLVPDGPKDFGVDDFCSRCQKCVTDCPPKAIFDTKQLVRGTERWYVDFDKCVPYMTEHAGCAICLSTCPWSRPGVAPSLTQKMLRRRARKGAEAVEAAAATTE